MAHAHHVRAGRGGGGAAGRGRGRRRRRGVGRRAARRGRPHAAGASHPRRRHHRPAARGAERAYRRARVRRRGVVGARRRRLVRRLGRPAAVPAGPRWRAGTAHRGAGRARARTATPTATSPRTAPRSSACGSGTRDRRRPRCATRSSGSPRTPPSEPEVLVSGPDFVAAPRLSPDGATLAWVQWNHPSMPWDDTQLRGPRPRVTARRRWWPAGRGSRSWSHAANRTARCWFLSDRTDWWNLYRWTPGSDIETVVRVEAEIGVPAWVFGSARYARARRRPGGVRAAGATGCDALAVRADRRLGRRSGRPVLGDRGRAHGRARARWS